MGLSFGSIDMKLKTLLLTLLVSLFLTSCGGGGGSSNTAPIIENIASQSVDEDNSKTVAIAATDTDNDSLTYSATSSASEVGVGVSGNVITLTPVLNWNGTSTITAKVNDGTTEATKTFTLTVNAVNDSPVLNAVSNQTATEDGADTVVGLVGSDVDGNSLTYSATSSEANVAVSITGNTVTLNPALNWNGISTITAKVNDGAVDSTTQTFTLTVSAVNDSPVVSTSIPDSSASLGSVFSLDTSNYITDPDIGDSLGFVALLSDNSSLPNWLSINQTSGVLSGSPVSSAASISVKVTATDTSNASIADTFLLTVPTTVVWNYGGWNDLIWGIESSADDSVWGNDNWNSKNWQ